MVTEIRQAGQEGPGKCHGSQAALLLLLVAGYFHKGCVGKPDTSLQSSPTPKRQESLCVTYSV